jgi:ATP-dependent exoDNAse (exonuclease V) beta subunit
VKESVLPEADDDAVRIFTIHGAKGLEFPITVVTGLNRAKAMFRSVIAFWDDNGAPQVKMRKFESPGFATVAEHEARMTKLEQDRLLYVATTRAQDHLVLSVHHKENDGSAAEEFVKLSADVPELWRTVEARFALDAPPSQSPPELQGDEVELRDDWDETRAALLEVGRRVPVVSATELAKRSASAASTDDPLEDSEPAEAESKDEPELEAPPWRRGRGGTALGRAVHAVLQSVDLATGEGLRELSRAQAAAEGIDDRAAEIERLARNALDTDVVKEAVKGRYWRELYVAAPNEDGIVVEGFIDLLYESPDGLVIVDWKTDSVDEDAAAPALGERYGRQLRAYADTLASSAGPVARLVLVVPDAPTEIEVALIATSTPT